MPSMTEAIVEPILVARAARGRHAWAEAFDAYTTADRDTPLAGEDLEGLAEAAFFVAQGDIELETKERAFKAYEADGEHRPAPPTSPSTSRASTATPASTRSRTSGSAGPSGSSGRTATRTCTAISPSSRARAARATG